MMRQCRFLVQITILLIIVICEAPSLYAASPRLSFSGPHSDVVAIDPASSSGLNALYVVESINGLSLTYTASSATADIKWLRFGASGAAYAESLDPSLVSESGNRSTLTRIDANSGYVIDDSGAGTYYVWICDYSQSPFIAQSLEPDPTPDCTSTTLIFHGEAARMTYHSINGRSLEIDRQIRVEWDTQVWNEERAVYERQRVSDTRAWLPENFNVIAPLCATTFSVTGDRFMEHWGQTISVTTPTVAPVSIDAHVTVSQSERDNSNEQKIEGVELGGSAPAEITFEAAVTEAAIFTEWQIASDPGFEYIDFRTNDTHFDYTFREMGNFYVRFVAANTDASCEYISDTYHVAIGESALVCPNAFSPGSSEGVNDEWKVSYKSLVSFECHIFNKWGVKVAELTHPSQGWDGRYNGIFVPAGVYYYVIKARGADGKEYNRSGDINILNFR